MNRIDLHIHTTASDGTDTPTQVVELAKSAGLTHIAITDHDTVAGVEEAQRAGETLGLTVLAGMELSTQWSGTELHLLGYFFGAPHQGLQGIENWNQENRRKRNEQIVRRLQEDGFPISLAELKEKNPGAVLGRPHIASALVEQGLVSSVTEAFERYLSPGCPYYVPREKMPLEEGIRQLIAAGGLPVLAHPLQYGFSLEKLAALTAQAVQWGICGMEVFYSGYTKAQQAGLLELAGRYELIPTGGSDYHGTRKPHIHLGSGTGDLSVPETAYWALKEKSKA
jgi:hypothetical protein